MTQAQYYVGHNQAGNLADLNVATYAQRPLQTTLRYARTVYAANGLSYPDGELMCDWQFSGLYAADFNALLTQFGLSLTTHAALGTFKLLTNDRNTPTWANYNGTISYRPDELKYQSGGWLDVVFHITALEAL